MKLVFTAPSVVPCDFLRTLLDVEGIPSMLKNEGCSSIVGRGLPMFNAPELPWAWPEVWVNDEDSEAAMAIAQEFQRKPQDPQQTENPHPDPTG